MLVLSLTRPESLHRYLGMKSTHLSPGPSSSSVASPFAQHPGHDTNKDYDSDSSNEFVIPPLHPIEYLKSCAKVHEEYMHHGDYWDTNIDPDMHNTATTQPAPVCSTTITYVLDGTVGLAADLALMAQAAALAREVNQILALYFLHSFLSAKSDILG
jgi:hypothetical protein